MKKDIIAKLLAGENITILRTNDDTASFDVLNRVLRLPAWKDITNNEELLLKLHEVGHALFTPCDMDPDHRKFFSAINVVEDARIERMIKSKYRGAAHAMKLGYTSLVEKDFFGINGTDLNTLNILDKLNLHFKIGDAVDVPINDLEQSYIDRIEKADDYSDIVYIAHELYKLAKEQKENEQEQEQPSNQTGDNDESETDQGPSESSENEQTRQDDSNDERDGEEGREEKTASNGLVTEDDSEELVNTQNNFDEKLNENVDKTEIKSVFIPTKHDWKNSFVSYKEYYKEIPDEKANASDLNYKFSKFQSTAKKSVAYLTSEFNRKKSAKDYRKTYSSKTGDLDVSKIWQHKFSDDIFKTTTISPTGKNHGFVMYLDWSGSMSDKIVDTVEQTIQFAQFARKIHQPFEVLAFSDRWDRIEVADEDAYQPEIGELYERLNYSNSNGVKLLQVLSSSMSNSEFNMAIKKLYLIAQTVCWSYQGVEKWYEMPRHYGLGATPLNSALVIGLSFTDYFVKTNRVEKLNVIVLSDGRDTYSFNSYNDDGGTYNPKEFTGWIHTDSIAQITDKKTRKTYDVKKAFVSAWRDEGRIEVGDITSIFLTMYKDRFNAAVTGIFIGSKRDLFYKAVEAVGRDNATAYKRSLTKFGYAALPETGYDANFLIVSSNRSNEEVEIKQPTPNKSGNITRAAYANAFKKSLNAKSTNKNMLREMSSIVA